MTLKIRHMMAVSGFALACVALAAPQVIAQSDTSTQNQAPAATEQGGTAPTGGNANAPAATEGAASAESETPAKAESEAPAKAESETTATAETETAPSEEKKVATAISSQPVPEIAEKAIEPIPQPANEVEAKAFAALEKHCARCHQDGKLEGRLKPAKGFGNILHLAQLAKDPSLVIPGNPDASEIIKQMASGDMPYDIKDGSNLFAPTPKAEEVAAIRDWIISLKDAETAACSGREFVSDAQAVAAIAADLEKRQDHEIKGMRYISLVNLYNACATKKEMKVYRQAIVKLLNSLSQNSDVLTVKEAVIDEAGTVIGFNLADLKWTEADWELIAKAYPYNVRPDVNQYSFLTSQLSTKTPYIRGDWLAFTASRPPLYYDLLKMPKTFQELEAKLGLNTLENIKNFAVHRAGFQRSLVSRNNRLIERHTSNNGFFWTSYDFAGNRGSQNLFSHPLGPTGKGAFKADGGETIFSLPNGFTAFYLNTAKGKRLDKGPTTIVLDPDRKDLAVMNGISCMGCHDQAMRKAKDDIRAHVINDRNFPKDVRKAVEALYPPREEMDKIIAGDAKRTLDAWKRAGIDPSLKLDGIEMINALSNRYEKDVHLRLAAAEYGLTPEQFEQAAAQRGGDAGTLLRRLKQGVVPRDTFEDLFATLVSQITDGEIIKVADAGGNAAAVAKPNTGDTAVTGAFKLTLIADKTKYHVNENPVFVVQSDRDCHLTLINIDQKGTGTVLFPNKFQQNNFIKANKAFEFPGPDAPFQFRMKDPGVETVIAICDAKNKRLNLVKHNFNTSAFTNLGDYEKFATRAIAVEAATNKKVAVKHKVVNKIATRKGNTRTAIKIAVE